MDIDELHIAAMAGKTIQKAVPDELMWVDVDITANIYSLVQFVTYSWRVKPERVKYEKTIYLDKIPIPDISYSLLGLAVYSCTKSKFYALKYKITVEEVIE